MAFNGVDSPESGFLVETVPSDGEATSLASGATSAGSATLEFPDGVTFHDLVDLTPESFCRVIMKGDRGKPPRVCGTPHALCRRSNHGQKRLKAKLVAPGGWYVRFGNKNGYSDGREDLGAFPAEEVEDLKAKALARDKADLEAFLPPPEEVTFMEELATLVPGGKPTKEEQANTGGSTLVMRLLPDLKSGQPLRLPEK